MLGPRQHVAIAPYQPGHATIRVLVVASRQADEASEDLRAMAHLAIEESNQTFDESGIDLRAGTCRRVPTGLRAVIQSELGFGQAHEDR
jgi:hypothetical protein